jgi:GH15 family glucan-1,4-alpha-glucosidase
MTGHIADYALIGDCETAALVGRNASIDWLCWPRFDSPACFAALVGRPQNGYWRICPTTRARVKRRYRPHSLILETTFKTDEGQVTLVDFMPMRDKSPRVIRMIRGDRGTVHMRMDLCLQFDYGRQSPLFQRNGRGFIAAAGRHRIAVFGSVPVQERGGNIIATFAIKTGQCVSFELAEGPRSASSPKGLRMLLAQTERAWKQWSANLKYNGPHADVVERSLITLKALTYRPSGGIVAAPTTSLPELPGGSRNWDYRYCWLRDATFSLLGFLHAGYHNEARSWKNWLLRAAGASPSRLRVMYDVTGKRVNNEWKARWLAGYKGATPVRIGNAASKQFQLDIFGELADALYQAGTVKNRGTPTFRLLVKLLSHLGKIWRRPDHGIWEVRGRRLQFTHSKVMCWVAFDRVIRAAEQIGVSNLLPKWRAIRQEIHDSVCESGFDVRLGSFVQSYGSEKVDASLLLLPLVGFLPPADPRIAGTVRLIEKKLIRGGLVRRREKEKGGAREGAFLPCSFWLADYYDLVGRQREAQRWLRRLMNLRNDLGLLSEEYSVTRRRLSGNFPQALSHVALVNSIINLHSETGPSRQRSSGTGPRWLL